jgi:methylglutaconyl-CoA hydratase
LLDSLSEELNQLSINTDVSVIVLRSEGTGAFFAGASFAVSNLEEGTKFFSGFAI